MDLSKVTITVNKYEILRLDVSGVRNILDGFPPDLVERNRNGVTILVNGYEDNPRELVIIPEVRLWFHRLFEVVPEIFFWMDLRPPYLTFYAIMASAPVRRDGGTSLSAEDLKNFMLWGYTNLNVFCKAHGFHPGPSNEHIKNCIIATG